MSNPMFVETDVTVYFFCQAEDGIRDHCVTGVQTCALPICHRSKRIREAEIKRTRKWPVRIGRRLPNRSKHAPVPSPETKTRYIISHHLSPKSEILSLKCIEPLEARIAPAAVLVNATTANYNDVDGAHVTVTFSNPILTAANVSSVLLVVSSFGGDVLKAIDLTGIGSSAQGTNIAITASLAPGTGDGLANVGRINATGIDLGSVKVKGDLAAIDAGDANTATVGLQSLNVQSLGRLGLITGSPDLDSHINGAMGALKVKKDLVNAVVN